jgi:rubrerythrin
MNLQNIITEIEKVDPEVYDRLDTRRKSMKQFASIGKVIAAVALPSALSSLFKKAYGQSNNTAIVEVLNFALTLEHLEAEFYTRAVATPPALLTGAALQAFTTIRDHENAHVALLQTVIRSLNGTPVAKPTFDFTGGNGNNAGPYTGVFTNYDTLLAVAQAFEDTGVRAYKGQAGNLISNNDILTAALQIHAVEARHAAHLRYMRKNRGAAQDPWITGADPGGISGPATAVYAGEDVTTQANVPIVGVGGSAVDASDASEAFDEPLTKEQVLAIVDPFIV